MELSVENQGLFVSRHIGPDEPQIAAMLTVVGAKSLQELAHKTVPASIRLAQPLTLPAWENEHRFLAEARALASENQILTSHIGMGYYDCVIPGVIQRNVLENPGWYTAYTPYQAEIAQGRLEALINFQTTVLDLTGMDIANASLLDEGTAAAEAMAMLFALREKDQALTFFASRNCHPQTLDVLRTRAQPLGIELVIGDETSLTSGDPLTGYFGMLLQYPDTLGTISEYHSLCEKAHAAGLKVAVATDLLALVLLASPGSWRRYSCGLRPAIRSSHGFWRTACGIFCHPGRVQTTHARTYHRRFPGCPRPPRLSHGSANPRTAHPPR
jgi:glycine dehydrogenase